MRSTVRPGSAKANGMPSGLPELVETNGMLSATLRVISGKVRAATSRPSGRLERQRSGCWHLAPVRE
jgi:hypothetical protein